MAADPASDIDPVDRMIRRRASKSLLLNGVAPLILGVASLFFNPCWFVTVMTVFAAVSTFVVPSRMRKRLEEPQLFPEGAAMAGRAFGLAGCVITVSGSVFWAYVAQL